MYNERFAIQWGTDAAPSTFKVLADDETWHTPDLVVGITETAAGSGEYYVKATMDPAWGVQPTGFFCDEDGMPFLFDKRSGGRADVVMANGEALTPADPSVFRLAVTPFVASVTNPRYATRDLPPIPRHSGPTDYWTIVDANGVAVPLTGKTVRFVVSRTTDAGDADDKTDDTLEALYQYESGTDTDNITIGGDDGNQVTITHDPANTGTAGAFTYELWNVTDNVMLASGKLTVRPAVKSYP